MSSCHELQLIIADVCASDAPHIGLPTSTWTVLAHHHRIEDLAWMTGGAAAAAGGHGQGEHFREQGRDCRA